ncbi:MAG: DUF937 domain-containing protein [Oscillospiraceae bacterium]|nr:DUF937 domain-containing protein [Oscillospiraceae bacterium]
MNLLSLILKSLLTDDTLTALVKKTGLSKAILKKLIPLAIPLLIKFMTSNASSQAGALSLLNALGQHTNKKSLADQITEADAEDGSRILGHIFGGQSDAVVNSLAQQSGVSSQNVSHVLAEIAPAVLSSLSAANSTASSAKVDLSDGLDLSELMTLFGGAAQSQSAGNNMLSSLLGGSSSLGGGLFGSLLGATAQQADNDASVNGTQLLSLLSALK